MGVLSGNPKETYSNWWFPVESEPTVHPLNPPMEDIRNILCYGRTNVYTVVRLNLYFIIVHASLLYIKQLLVKRAKNDK